jgi:hypothetical protein
MQEPCRVRRARCVSAPGGVTVLASRGFRGAKTSGKNRATADAVNGGANNNWAQGLIYPLGKTFLTGRGFYIMMAV